MNSGPGNVSATPDQSAIRILVVDDHPLLREGIAALIDGQTDMTLVAQACNGREGIENSERTLLISP